MLVLVGMAVVAYVQNILRAIGIDTRRPVVDVKHRKGFSRHSCARRSPTIAAGVIFGDRKRKCIHAPAGTALSVTKD